MTSRKSFLSPSVGEMYSLKRNSVSTMPSAWRWSAREASAKLSASRRNFRLNSFCALARMRPHRLEIGQPLGHGGAARREAPVLADELRHLGEAVGADVEVPEGEAAPLVLGPAGDALAGHVHPRQLEVAPHRALEAVDEGLVLGEVDGAQVAHGALLLRSSRRAGGREPSG